MTGVKVFVVGVDFYKPLMEFIESKMLNNGIIDDVYFEIIRLTEDLKVVVEEIEQSLLEQIEMLKDVGLGDSQYCKSLSEFSTNKNIKYKDI